MKHRWVTQCRRPVMEYVHINRNITRSRGERSQAFGFFARFGAFAVSAWLRGIVEPFVERKRLRSAGRSQGRPGRKWLGGEV